LDARLIRRTWTRTIDDLFAKLERYFPPLWNRIGRIAAVVVIAAVVIAQWVRMVVSPRTGDFALHHAFGRRFWEGALLYERGMDAPYPPFWAMAHASIAWMDAHLAQVIAYPLGLAGAALLLWLLTKMTRPWGELRPIAVLWVLVFTLDLSARYWVRDLLECLVNTWMVALAWSGIYLWSKQRPWMGACRWHLRLH
jgi:hypothetical protein